MWSGFEVFFQPGGQGGQVAVHKIWAGFWLPGLGAFPGFLGPAGFCVAQRMIRVREDLDHYLLVTRPGQTATDDGDQLLRWTRGSVLVAEDHQHGTVDALPGWTSVISGVAASRVEKRPVALVDVREPWFRLGGLLFQ